MTKLLAIISIICAVSFCSFSLCAIADVASTDEDVYAYRTAMGNKAQRGVQNILFGWTEAPKRIVEVTRESNNPVWGLFAGGFQGVMKAMARTVSGVSDVVTAPVDPDKAPLVQPDIAVE